MKKGIKLLVLGAALFLGQAQQVQAAILGGLVLDESTGGPIPNAHLRLEKEVECWPENLFLYKTFLTTDENGAFSATDLEEGNYQLVVTKDNLYLPEAYDNASPYNDNGRTVITLAADEVRDDVFVELARRPFYFEGVEWEPFDFLEQGGQGKAIVTVMNTTGKKQKMRFWLAYELKRQEGSRFDDSTSIIPGHRGRRLHALFPGSNTIELEVALPEGIGEWAHLDYTITGGRSRWQPMMPAWNTPPRLEFISGFCMQPPVSIGPEPPALLPLPLPATPERDLSNGFSSGMIQANPGVIIVDQTIHQADTETGSLMYRAGFLDIAVSP